MTHTKIVSDKHHEKSDMVKLFVGCVTRHGRHNDTGLTAVSCTLVIGKGDS